MDLIWRPRQRASTSLATRPALTFAIRKSQFSNQAWVPSGGIGAPDLADEKPAGWKSGGAKVHRVARVPEKETETYFNELLIEVNLSFRFVPRPLTAAMMASEIPAAISPYSIAVAPDSSDKKLNKVRFNTASFRFPGW